ncbi:endonuclease domain-containing 1 protein-like [Trematomus bernacchii]|uniref:endonuclease domain-containing 1 protein-like n=1 Tax=Trematomus bernacchii TaxID=40690 RepID=UPI00146D6370|nr:endonuclease domain-containing 1 protein-like [Trematomus bernacchii]
MALLKMWSIPPLAALLLLSIVPTGSKVVDSMSECAEFLLNETPPNVPGILEGGNIQDQNRYKPICQTFRGIKRYVTLYDTKNKIPVFSASKYIGTNSTRPREKKDWKIEPQLEDIRDDENMMMDVNGSTYNKQAVDSDYINHYTKRGFDRGHLFPCSYASTVDDKNSTFTLTNIVPQNGFFNKGSWNKMEICIKCVLDEYCINNNNIKEGFLVIGAQPGNNIISNKVNVPSMLWSAFCCYSHSENRWLASAHWGPNIDGREYLQTKTLAELHSELSTGFEVFPQSQCPLHTTVTEFYPKLNAGKKQCQCPPPILTTSAAPNLRPLVPHLDLLIPHLHLLVPHLAYFLAPLILTAQHLLI